MNNGVEILIAEDSPTQAEQLRCLLEEHGYRVTVAANGKKALAEAKKHKPTLIITDIVMPVMDGYAFCMEVKSDETLKDTPVVLLTSLSSPQDVIKGLECNADNFIRKPYNERYLLSRIKHILTNRELRNSERIQPGVMLYLAGQKHFITSDRQQILDLLVSTYEQAVHINQELSARELKLSEANQWLNGLYLIAKGLNRSTSEQQVVEEVLECAMNMPGIQACWIALREGESDFRFAGARGLPPSLEVHGAMEGDCLCRRKLLSGELRQTMNVFECERLEKVKGDEYGIRIHASIPLWIGDRTLGILNLGGAEERLTRGDTMKILNGIGNQIGIALERARLHEHLERRVEERTAALTAEVAQRKQAEESLTLFRSLIDHTNDAIEVIDPDTGRFLDVNEKACQAHGYTREEYLALTIPEIDPMVGARPWAEVREEMWRSGSGIYDTQHRRKDGSVFPVEVNCTYIRLDRDYMLAVVRDITERKRFEAQLEATVEARTRELQAANVQLKAISRHKSDFLANMSHELRTPLNSILGFAELLQDQQFGTPTPKQARYLSHIYQSGQHLLALINDLLDLSKVEAGRLDLRPETFTLSDALTAALEQFRVQVDAKGVALSLHLREAPDSLVADPLRFKQILYNLLSNAIKFTPAGGSITVTARTVRRATERTSDAPAWVEIAVQDTGIGIKTEDLGRLFQEFTQLDSSLAKPHQGTGLGLALTKRLIELHGGSVTVTSPGEGQGSIFTVILPLRPLRTRGRILLVEDDARLRAQIDETLQNDGFGVDLVWAGEAALAQAARVPPDLVILDLVLSGLQGIEVLRRLRAEESQRLPIIILARGEGDPVEEALALGADEFLAKPVSLGVLTDTVERLLRKGGGAGVSAPVRASAEDHEGG